MKAVRHDTAFVRCVFVKSASQPERMHRSRSEKHNSRMRFMAQEMRSRQLKRALRCVGRRLPLRTLVPWVFLCVKGFWFEGGKFRSLRGGPFEGCSGQHSELSFGEDVVTT